MNKLTLLELKLLLDYQTRHVKSIGDGFRECLGDVGEENANYYERESKRLDKLRKLYYKRIKALLEDI